MVQLTLVGLSGDKKRLLLVSDSGEEFTLPVDNLLRAALRGEHSRLGQLEIQMESTLRPRDIQARIRAGESPESVAQAAHTTVEKILPFANPVLAERAHVAERAQRASVRRKAGDQGARTLGQAVAAQLSPLALSTEIVEWDSWRREDGRWTLTGAYVAGKRKGTAQFTFDAPGNYVVAENDDARWLVGEPTSAPAKPERRDDLKQARQRRLSAVPEDELPLGDDAIELANEASGPDATPTTDPSDAEASDADANRTDEESTVDLTETADRVRGAETAAPTGADDEPTLSPTPEPLADEPAATTRTGDRPASSTDDGTTAGAEKTAAEEPAAEEPAPRKTPRRKGRASVPSWDEIMFGGGKSE
ncbi:septation protein SepH [Nocardioides jensenii]|uniref:septation protein SepH n=1 Tax=Nocardioides jensenii TaxID=1843 RepID=UPI00083283B6|nr:septation protein SepH [Nocardioides jensenii]